MCISEGDHSTNYFFLPSAVYTEARKSSVMITAAARSKLSSSIYTEIQPTAYVSIAVKLFNNTNKNLSRDSIFKSKFVTHSESDAALDEECELREHVRARA